MTEVRKHRRVTASGKLTTVRHHTRSGEKTRREDEAEAAREAWADRNAPHVSSLAPAEPEPQAEEWWAGDDEPPPGEFWDEDDAGEDCDHSPAFAAILKQNPDLGRGYDRLREQREAGYTGPIDQDGNPAPGQKAGKKAAVVRYKAAREALGNYYCDEEDDEYHRLNDAVIEAAKDVPWWRRG